MSRVLESTHDNPMKEIGTCELIELAKEKRISADEIFSRTKQVESIFSSDDFDVAVEECQQCGKLFLYCFRQYTSPTFDDDYWTFWLPATHEEIQAAKTANILIKFMGEFVSKRPHICWHPDGYVYWSKNGNFLALIIFLP
ncbi:MAG: hypothetical protein ACLP9S_18555 [Syntrophales bacterium]